MSRRRRIVFALVALAVGLVVGLGLAEWALRAQADHVASSERMDPGLIEYDRRLGWRLKAGWGGTHSHYDFDVTYHIHKRGFRGRVEGPKTAERVVVLGDSFTFGLGVADDETFVDRLDRDPPTPDMEFLNFGVPGYSPDQAWLLLERKIETYAPDHVVLVVCLVNDVFDCRRALALQAARAKPFVAVENGVLEWRGEPVPKDRQNSAHAMQTGLARYVRGDEPPPGGVAGWLGRRELMKRLGWFQPSSARSDAWYEERFADDMRVFAALLAHMEATLRRRGVAFTVALLPGRALGEDLGTGGAAYQDYLRRALLLHAADGPGVVDLTPALQAEDDVYHPNEGHLNARGHRVVADTLRTELSDD